DQGRARRLLRGTIASTKFSDLKDIDGASPLERTDQTGRKQHVLAADDCILSAGKPRLFENFNVGLKEF
ncbi:MAG: hypothetical protein M3362_15150, partial [Acidobacteriota bacterium]|nr:hypothetical protein [Acidobacteriota bacterium]